MRIPRYYFVIVLSFLLPVLRAASPQEPVVWMGMSREQLTDELGEPASTVSAGNKQILLYADGARFEFKDDQLVLVRSFKGQTALSKPEPAAPSASAATPPSGTVTSVPAKPSGEPLLKPSPPPVPATVVKELENRGVPTYSNVVARAMPALRRAAGFFEEVYDPQLFDDDRKFWPRPTLILAALFRLGLTIFALRIAMRLAGRSMGWFDYFFLGSVELIARVAISSAVVLLAARSMPFVALELATTASLLVAAVTRPEIQRTVVALRVVLVAKLIAFAVSFACFFSLLDLTR